MMRISSTRVRRLANTYWPHGVAAVGLVCFLFYVASDGGAHVPPQIRAPPKLPKANTFAVQDSIFGFPRPGAPFGNCFGCVQKRPLKIRHRSYNPDKHTVYYGYDGQSADKILGVYGISSDYVHDAKDPKGLDFHDWDLLWTMMPQWASFIPGGRNGALGLPKKWQICNHCLSMPQGHGIHGVKNAQADIFHYMQAKFGKKRYGYTPETFTLPAQAAPLLEQVDKLADGRPGESAWIMKEGNGARGMGLSIVRGKALAKQVQDFGHQGVAQRYETEPLLIYGHKFHLRVYMVIANMDPLRVLVCKEGIVLLAVKKYNTDPASYGDREIHLTNAAVAGGVRKKHGNIEIPTSMPLSTFWDIAKETLGLDPDVVLGRIKDVFTKLAMSTQVAKDGGNNNNIQPGGRGRDINGFERRRSGSCFDLFGADIMFRKDLTPILMEVNNAPELYSKDPSARPINHLVHTRLLNEVIPLLATVRSMSPGRAQSFNYLLSTFFLGTTLPAVPSAVLKGDDNTLEDGEGGPAGATALRMCAPPAYDEWGQPASRKDAPSDLEMSRLGCVSEQNVEALWRAFDQECDMKLFVIAYPSLDTFDQYTDLMFTGLSWGNRLLHQWVRAVQPHYINNKLQLCNFPVRAD